MKYCSTCTNESEGNCIPKNIKVSVNATWCEDYKKQGIKNVPKTIFLHAIDKNFNDFDSMMEVVWNTSRVNDNDIEYTLTE